MDEYGTLIMTYRIWRGKNCLLRLLNESDKPVKEAHARTTKQPSITSSRATTIYALSSMITTTENGIRVIMQPNDSPKPLHLLPKATRCKAKRDVQERGIHVYPTLQAEACSYTKAEGWCATQDKETQCRTRSQSWYLTTWRTSTRVSRNKGYEKNRFNKTHPYDKAPSSIPYSLER